MRHTHLLQFLHVFGLDVHNVKALVVDAEIPKVDAQVIGGDERLIVTKKIIRDDSKDECQVGRRKQRKEPVTRGRSRRGKARLAVCAQSQATHLCSPIQHTC